MIKVLFYHANDVVTNAAETKKLFLGVASLYIKTYLELNYTENLSQVEWLIPLQHRLTDDQLIDTINQTGANLLCTSHYIWNHSYLIDQLERIKPKINSNIKIVAGGPSINVHIDSEFFEKYTFIDYAIYGAGEAAFGDLIDSLINGKKLIAFNTSNLAWYDHSKQRSIITNFKYVPQLPVSPYLHNKELFSKMIAVEKNKNFQIVIPYELTRGCPYKCTFCDWNSGLSNKVTRRKDTYKQEIDFFQSLGVRDLYLSDANVGQYQEDVDMIQYLAEKNINESAKFSVDGNYSKLRKENNLKIYHWLGKGNLIDKQMGFTISVQDINPEVLENINRPDVGWDEHVKIIKELKYHYPDRYAKIQLILGLPGQTVESWRATLRKVSSHDIIIQSFVNELIPASPAALDLEYNKKFNFKYSNSKRLAAEVNFFHGSFSKSCYSFSQIDFVDMSLLTIMYNALVLLKANSEFSQQIIIEDIVDKFIESDYYKNLKNNLIHNWIYCNKFYFTIDFNNKKTILSACQHIETARVWVKNTEFVKFLIKESKEKNFLKESLSRKFPNTWTVSDIHNEII